MPCYHPLHAFDVGLKTDSGKIKYKVVPGDVEHYLYDNKYYDDFIEIPCGKCIGCRLEYSRQWAVRCMLESQYHEQNCFITLTYDDDHLPPQYPRINFNTGEYLGESPIHSLIKDDFRLFMKRLRDRLSNKYDIQIRFFACGEYGKSFRPHYHAIIFGYDFSDDRQFFKSNFRGEKYYISQLLAECWPFGFHIIADCTFDTCAYVARYVLKKQKGQTDYLDLMYEPEFTLMSRKPGIARQYYEDHKNEMYPNCEIFLSTPKGGKKLRPVRYYDKLYDIEEPDVMAAIKDKRRIAAENASRILDSRSSKSHLDRLKAQEDNVLARTKILKERSVEK